MNLKPRIFEVTNRRQDFLSLTYILKFWYVFKVVLGGVVFCVGPQVVFAFYVCEAYVFAFSEFACFCFVDGGEGEALFYVVDYVCSCED
jgi:hypothetical protein